MTDIKVSVNQIWAAMDERVEKPLRRIRIIAKHPDGGYVYKELGGGTFKTETGRIGHIPSFNLLTVFTLEQDVCTHRYVGEFYEDEKDHPTYWICNDCGDKFPIIGDADFWFPKLVGEVNATT